MSASAKNPASRARRPKRQDRPRVPRWLRCPLWILAGLLVLFALHVPILIGMAKFLSVEDPPGRADYIVLLGGGIQNRPQKVAELYRAGVAPRVVLARVQDLRAERMKIYPNETDASVKLLGLLGVPASAITVLSVPGGTTSTMEEAAAFRTYIEQRGPATVVLVTSRPHTRRVRWAFRRELRGLPVILRMAGADDPRFNERNWWRTEAGAIQYFVEYLTFAHNLIYR
jgi:uncharacterized SAM-binding protein YcdF (DUF218 family)